jgi:hypothetical protein
MQVVVDLVAVLLVQEVQRRPTLMVVELAAVIFKLDLML